MDPNGRLLAVKRIDLTGADDFTIEGYRNEIDLLQRLQYSKSVIKLYDRSVVTFSLPASCTIRPWYRKLIARDYMEKVRCSMCCSEYCQAKTS